MVKCELCRGEFDVITWKHLKKHHISVNEYKTQFPTSLLMSPEALERKRTSAGIANSSRKGIKRSDTVVNKIKQTKALNPISAWNKGIAKTEAQKQQISAVKKQQYASGEIQHWNTGQITSDETKLKISTTSLAQHRQQSTNSKQKREKTIAEKTKAGWRRTVPNSSMTDSHRQAWLAGGAHSNQTRTQLSIDRCNNICTANNINIVEVSKNSYQFTLSCTTCNTQYTRTRNAFVVSKINQLAYRCPSCFPREIIISKAEQEVATYIQSLVSSPIQTNDRTILNGKEIDCYVPALRVGFEYNGLYWHSESAGKDRKYHAWKTQTAEANGVRLITIFEDEWLTKPNIVKSRIAHVLNCTPHTHRVYARNTTIRPISNQEKKEFLQIHHIQGNDLSAIRYGAFFENDLLAVMTFTKTNMSKGGDGSTYELNRFAVKTDFHVPGIASKLFQHFVRQFNTVQIVSYADRRWCTGNVYKHLGFSFIGTTPPSYWYTNDYTSRTHRSAFMKHTLANKLKTFDPVLTEWENMQLNGYDRIWDCGTNKFVFSK